MMFVKKLLSALPTLAVGAKFSFTKTIESCDVYLFAGISGDYNPAHINEEHGKNSMFKHRVAHGMVCAGLISGAVTQKVSAAAVISKQNITFKKPVFIGDTVTINLVVLEVKESEGIFETTAVNQREEAVAEGQITVKFPKVD